MDDAGLRALTARWIDPRPPRPWGCRGGRPALRRHHHRHGCRRRNPRASAGPLRQDASCSSSGVTTYPASGTTGSPPRCSSRASTGRRSSGWTSDGDEFPPEVNYYVGGNTKFYGAALFRLRPQDFGEIRHHGGDLAGLADRLRRPRAVLHPGRAALPGPRPARRGPDRGPRQRAVPVRPGRARTPDPAAERRPGEAGPAPVPPADRREPATRTSTAGPPSTSACIRCNRVDGFPCLLGAKSDAQVICVDPALEHDNVHLVTNAYVDRLETDATGRTVTKVVRDAARRRLAGLVRARTSWSSPPAR